MQIEGSNGVVLRIVQSNDAQFILNLRTDSELNQHLSQVGVNLQDQINFIEKYKEREKNKLEYYFIIEYKNNLVGTVRLYNINYDNSTFIWGSWIIKKGNPGEVALSSAYMTYYFGFNYLNLDKALIDVRKENKSVCEFYKLYCSFLYEDELNYYLEFKKEDFNKYVNRFKSRICENIVIENL